MITFAQLNPADRIKGFGEVCVGTARIHVLFSALLFLYLHQQKTHAGGSSVCSETALAFPWQVFCGNCWNESVEQQQCQGLPCCRESSHSIVGLVFAPCACKVHFTESCNVNVQLGYLL